jgi:uncharacterized membrane protein
MVWLNSVFLLGQSFIPFPTALAGEYPANPLAVSFFGVVFALNTLLFLILQAYIIHHLIKPELAGVKGLVGPASYLIGAALAWVSVHAAFVVYALTPLFYITPREMRTVREH